MTNLETVKQQLKNVKLLTASAEINEVIESHKKSISLDWLIDLLSREIDSRNEKALLNRISRANFPELKTIEGFDWEFNKEIEKEKIMEIAKLEFLKRNGICLFLGKPGTGKTHLALAIGLNAVKNGYVVYCTSLKKLIMQITVAKLKNTLDILFKKILSANLLILDDWAVVTMERSMAEEVLDLLDRRKQSSAMILTSNRDISEWDRIFPDPILASATIDRIFDRAEISNFVGDSYRLKGRIEINDFDIKKFMKENSVKLN